MTLSAAKNIYQAKLVHVVFNSYCELSVKEGERVRRAAKSGEQLMLLIYLSQSPYHSRLIIFWASTQNKEGLQVFARDIALRDFDNVVVSGMVVNEKVHSAKAQVNRRSEKEVPELSHWQEEADSIIMSHIAGLLTMVLRGLS